MDEPIDIFLLALPETAGSALYGMLDVLASAGVLWREMVGEPRTGPLLRPRIVSTARGPLRCGHGIPVEADIAIDEIPAGGIVVLPELWLAPDDDIASRYDALKTWLRDHYHAGGTLYSACSGSVLLAASGLLDGREATSHWGYEDLFRTRFPGVRFNPAPNLVVADPTGRIVTAGGTTSWHDLAIHIVARHCSPGEALHLAKVYLLKWHSEGQLPYAARVRRQPHADAAVRRAEDWLAAHFRLPNAVAALVAGAGLPERSLKRRFKAATGVAPIDYVQNLRIEEAKRQLEGGDAPADQIAADVGYENAAFFRRLFRRCTGLAPSEYRRLFRPMARVAGAVDA